MKVKRSISRLDYVILLVLAMTGLWMAAASVNKPVHPAEDAAMLMRYSQNLAQGHGIVWNIGQPPVDGATDFLFMILLAGLYALGGGLESTVLWVGGIAHGVTVLLVYYGIRRHFNGGILAGFISAAFLLCGPGLRYAEASFGTTFFALFVCLSWLTAQSAVKKPTSITRAFAFALSGLLMGLTRPEGVLIAGFMLLAVLLKLGWKKSSRILIIFCGVFLILGGGYFLWRWNYFGHPLPNPFYKKGGGSLYTDSLQEAWKALLELSFPFWLVYAVGLVSLVWAGVERTVIGSGLWQRISALLLRLVEPAWRGLIVKVSGWAGLVMLAGFTMGLFRQSSNLHKSLVLGRYSPSYAGLLLALLVTGLIALTAAKWLPAKSEGIQKADSEGGRHNPLQIRGVMHATLFMLIPILGFTLMWVLLSNEMNYLWRFQYPILAVVLMGWPLVLKELWLAFNIPALEEWPLSRRGMTVLAVILLGAGLVFSQTERWKIAYSADGRFEVAQYLSQFANRQYTIATTEAGLLPLYSDWQAVDTWGLNDAWIARNDGITADYLAKANPQIIMFHADFSPILPRAEAGDAWSRMTLTLDRFARENNYTLAAVYGDSPADSHYYYVRPDFPESAEIVAFIRRLDGGKYHYGAHTLDYSQLQWKKEK